MKHLIISISAACMFFCSSLQAEPDGPNGWGLEPLGKAVEVKDEGPVPIKQELRSLRLEFPAKGEPVTLVENGIPQCLLVLPEKSTGTERSAADLLRSTLRKMSGADLPTSGEDKIRVENDSTVVDTQGRRWRQVIWIGNTRQAGKQYIRVDDLRPEGYRLKSEGGWLFVIGNDRSPSGKPLQGTGFAATELLEDQLGVRWLWPGDLGTVIPKRETVAIPAINEQNEPALLQRIVRSITKITDREAAGLKLLGGTEKESQILSEDQQSSQLWLSRQKCGCSLNLYYNPPFGEWYEEYGKDHPDWFALQPNGSREQHSKDVRLCESNPEVARQRAREIIAEYKAKPGMESAAMSPSDGGVDQFCMCPECRKLDPPNGATFTFSYVRDGKVVNVQYPSLSDRVATFYNRIAEEVAKTLPNAKLAGFAYSCYRDAPLGVTLKPSIIIGFVGMGYFDESQRQADLNRWDGWSRRASQLFLRPNFPGGGEDLPAVFVHRLGDTIRHCYQTGMIAADFDSLTGSWATQGLNSYVLAKLLWNPAEDVDVLVKDYCEKGFGPAADKIQEYFSELEMATDRVANRNGDSAQGELREEEKNVPATKVSDVFRAAVVKEYFINFTPEFVEHLRGILKQAEEEAGDDPAIRARIEFLGLGLDYADLYRTTLESADKRQALQNLLDWYRKTYHEHPEAINAVNRLWRTGSAFQGLQ